MKQILITFMALAKYIVPQFIDVEDKIIGPITVRQFILILAAFLIGFLLYRFGSLLSLIAGGIIDFGIFGTLAFAKINGRPIHFFLLNFVQTLLRPRLRIWNKEAYIMQMHEKVKSDIEEKPKLSIARKEPVTGSRLSDLTLIVNTGGMYAGEVQASSPAPVSLGQPVKKK